MHKALHPRDDIDRLYVSRKGGEELPSLKITLRQLKKEQRKANYIDEKQHKQHKCQKNHNNKKIKIGRKTTVWIFQAPNKQDLIREDLEMAKKKETFREKRNLF